ncbi:MAG TPA: lamin tail domain-containing protein, partial [Verrucomicrobiae bacterium]|nr:lamin tail domain-containing protein [Verrucomicrobiae bacterium]
MKTLIRKAFFGAALCASLAGFNPQLYAQHGLLREIYADIDSSSGIAGLLADVNFPNNPAAVSVVSEFEAPDSFGDQYGQRIRGFIEAPQTGSYTFWISSDDQGQLYLSSNEQPENKALIAEVFGFTAPRTWDTEPNQRSRPITLEKGKRYYIEALMVEGSGGDHLAVRWQLPDGTIEEPIPSERIYVELIPPQISQQPRNVTVSEGEPASFTVQLGNRGTVEMQWFRNDVLIPGATNFTYTIPATSIADNGSRFRVRLTNEFATNAVFSSPAFLTVQRDILPPTLLAAQTSGENDLVTVTFSEPVDVISGSTAGNYSISGGVQVLSATVDGQGRTVILHTTPLRFGEAYFANVNNVRDRALQPNAIEPDSQAEFTFGFSALDPDTVYGRFESPGPSSRRTGLVISEIMYHPAPRTDGRNIQFIEIYNSEETIVSIGGYRLTGGIEYVFPEGTFLAARSYGVVAAVPLDIQNLYGVPRAFGPFTGELPEGGALRLLNDQGAVLLDLSYDTKDAWPSAADGAGPSLVLARPSYGEADPRAWEAGQFVGGTPGKPETFTGNPYRGLVVNEFLAHTDLPQVDFLELYNYSAQEIDLSGVFITDDLATNKFRIPDGTRLPALGLLSFNETSLNFGLGSGGERIIVRNPQRTRVIESVKFGPQPNGVSTGRFPDGNPKFRQLIQPTAGAANTRPLLPAVVINEIMYNPISQNDDEEYVELFNRSGSTLNLKGWRIDDGIGFTFPTDTLLAPGGYLVVAKNLSLLRANHPGVTAANSVGNFNGNLSNQGERIVLERPEISITTNGTQRATNVFHVLVDEVTYSTGGRWPHWADGGGSSMELSDANSDNDEASNWADSDETQKSSWITIERRGILDHGSTNFAPTSPSRNLHVLLSDAGEALIDNVQVLRDGGTNLVRNTGFETGLVDWLATGTHEESTLEIGGGHNSANALHIRATTRGDTAANRIRVRLNDGLTNGTIATLRADVRWLRGTPDILLRLHGNYLEVPGRMTVPKNLGSPGAANSRTTNNAPPIIAGVSHSPVLPVGNQDVIVTAQIDDPDRVAVAALFYRVDPKTNFTRVAMSYSGAGFYSGAIPGQTNLSTVGFYLEAFDSKGSIGRFPRTAPDSLGVILFGDGKLTGNLGTYRLWLTQTNIARWAARERSSNKALDATFVYNNERVVYNMGTLYSGSPFHWGNYTSPLGSSANYLMTFPDDDLFLGQNDFVLNLPSNLGSDSTGVREQVFFWMADQLNQPYNYRRFHHLFLNGRNRGLNTAGTTQRVFEDAQQPNRDFIQEWFPNDTDGDLHKIEDWFEYNDTFSFYNQ